MQKAPHQHYAHRRDEIVSAEVILAPLDNSRLASVCGHCHTNIEQVEKAFSVTINSRGNVFQISGDSSDVEKSSEVLHSLYAATINDNYLTTADVHLHVQGVKASGGAVAAAAVKQREVDLGMIDSSTDAKIVDVVAMNAVVSMGEGERSIGIDMADNGKNGNNTNTLVIRTPKLNIIPCGVNQINYVRSILKHDINFSVGPAGTGKTYLAVACAVAALQKEEVERIVLVRPVVEAGEHLGFLPGDISQKVDPYLRPLYDALYDMLGARQVEKLLETHAIEIAPLAFMRGRTLNASFIILDESQNSTPEQMQMFLTRIGFGSKAVITGDVTQVDLAKGKASGLIHATKILKDIRGISFNHFAAYDVVRHPLVQCIINAYAKECGSGENIFVKRIE